MSANNSCSENVGKKAPMNDSGVRMSSRNSSRHSSESPCKLSTHNENALSQDSSQSDLMESLPKHKSKADSSPCLSNITSDTPKQSSPRTAQPTKEVGKSPTNGHVSDSSSRSGAELEKMKMNSKTSGEKKKKGSYWYNVLSPTYKSRSEDFKKAFKDIAGDERLIVDYSCAMQKDILVHGRLYITTNWVCFYANIFRWETVLKIRYRDITAMTKEKTARVIPNAIQISTGDDKYFFTSFGARDKTYLMMFRVWQNALCEQQMTSHELWQWVHYSYGEELGLTSSDDDYIAPTVEEEVQFNACLQQVEPLLNASVESTTSDVTHFATKYNKHDGRIDFITSTPIKDPDDDADNHLPVNGDVSLPVPQDDYPPTYTSDGPSFVVPRPTPAPPPTTLSVPSHTEIAELPTDIGDTSDDDDGGEVRCSGHDHLDLVGVDDVFNVNIDKMFDMLFTDSAFFEEFTKSRKTFDVVHGKWPDDTDAAGEKKRTLNYTLSLNYSIGPKSSPLAETQICRQFKPSSYYLVDTECINSGIPYGDNFYVMNRYCLSRVNSTHTRLLVTSQIKYRKSVWGLVKGFIEKNATQGIIESFNALGMMLHEHALKQATVTTTQPTNSLGRKKVLRRRKTSERAPSTKRNAAPERPPPQTPTPPPKHTPARGTSVKAEEDVWQINLTADSLVKIVCVVLIVLVVFNMVLFYKLWTLEHKATTLQRTYMTSKFPSESPKNQEEWVDLLSQQQLLHHQEIERWKEVLTASVKLLDHMKLSLVQLHASVSRQND